MSKHPIFCSLLQQLHDDHRFSPDPFCALAEFKVLLNKAKKLTIRELSRKTLDSIGAKLLVASAALRAYRNRHLGTLMRCCEAWKLIEDCFDTSSFECVDFQRLSQILLTSLVKNLRTRETEITTPLDANRKKTLLQLDAGIGQRAWRNKKPVFRCSQYEESHPFRMKMTLVEDFVSIGENHLPSIARKVRDITSTKIFCDMFNKLLMTSVGLLIRLS